MVLLNTPVGLGPSPVKTGHSWSFYLGTYISRGQPFMAWYLNGGCSSRVCAGLSAAQMVEGREMLPLRCKLQGCGSLHRTLSQTRPLQQHTGPSRTVRRYPASGANGQLISNALPSGPGLELRDSSPQAAHVNRLSPLWGKAALPLDLGEQSI